MKIVTAIGEVIRKRRISMKLSLEEAAHLSDLSTNHLGNIERGEAVPKIDSLYKISVALNVKLSELVDIDSPISVKVASRTDKVTPLLEVMSDKDFSYVYKIIKDLAMLKYNVGEY